MCVCVCAHVHTCPHSQSCAALGIFPTQGLNLHLLFLLHWQMGSLPMCHLGSPYLVRKVVISKSWKKITVRVQCHSVAWLVSSMNPLLLGEDDFVWCDRSGSCARIGARDWVIITETTFTVVLGEKQDPVLEG